VGLEMQKMENKGDDSQLDKRIVDSIFTN